LSTTRRRIRGYIPSAGNVWNKKFKTAYGSEVEGEYEEHERDDSECKPDLIRQDIINRIQIITAKQ
jgi:hypothetical protein